MGRDTIGRPMEILLVEDSLTDAALAIGALRQSGIKHRFTLVRDGDEALEFLRQEGKFAQAPRPDLILLDLLLPKKDGLDVLSDMRADTDLQDIPVVIMTSSDADEDRFRAESLNVESYITKPVDLRKFIAVVRELKHHWHADLILPVL